jgi:hypothetical protein
MCFATTMAAAVAFQRLPDRSPFALIHWAVIAFALVAPLFLIPGLLSGTGDDLSARRRRCVRVVILAYLPLASALSLMAFGQR